jgi:hypothetical protein
MQLSTMYSATQYNYTGRTKFESKYSPAYLIARKLHPYYWATNMSDSDILSKSNLFIILQLDTACEQIGRPPPYCLTPTYDNGKMSVIGYSAEKQ